MTPDNALFIHSTVDEEGLTPAQFRVLCRVARRGECYESVPKMASGCKLHADTVRRSLKQLVELGWLLRQRRIGTTNLYEVNHSKIMEHPLGIKGRGDVEIKGEGGYEIGGDKVNPHKVNLSKDICSSDDKHAGDSSSGPTAEAIYQQYPRKQNKPSALAAIERSMQRFPSEHLMARTKLFAEVASKSWDLQFIKMPAKWFDEECFEEEPVVWAQTINSSWGRKVYDATGEELKRIRPL